MTIGPDDPQPDPAPPTGPRWEQAGDPTVPPALAALRRPLPEPLFVLYNPRTDRYCYRPLPGTEDCGLLCFPGPAQALAYAQARMAPRTYDEARPVPLATAHAMARTRHPYVNCLFFIEGTREAGGIREARVYYVR